MLRSLANAKSAGIEIDADRVCSALGGHKRRVAGPGRHVYDPLSGPHLGAIDSSDRRGTRPVSHERILTQAPRCHHGVPATSNRQPGPGRQRGRGYRSAVIARFSA